MRLLIVLTLIFALTSCGKKEVRNSVPMEEQPAELLVAGDQFFSNGDYENAFRAYGVVYYDFPSSREYIDAAIGLSKCYGAMENYEKEFDILYELLKQNLIPTKVPLVYNSVATFYERSAGISEQLTGEGTGDYETAISYYKKAISYPNSEDIEAKSYAQYMIGTLHEKLEQNDKAMEAYQLAQTVYQGSEWSLRAEQNIADLQVKLQRRAEYQDSGMLPDTPPADTLNTSPSLESDTPAETDQASTDIPPLDSNLVQPDTTASEPPRY